MRKFATIVGTVGLVLGFATAAAAQPAYSGDEDNPAVVRSELPAVSEKPAEVREVQVAGLQQLPVTGSDAGTLAAGGLVMVVAGGALLARSRKATPAA